MTFTFRWGNLTWYAEYVLSLVNERLHERIKANMELPLNLSRYEDKEVFSFPSVSFKRPDSCFFFFSYDALGLQFNLQMGCQCWDGITEQAGFFCLDRQQRDPPSHIGVLKHPPSVGQKIERKKKKKKKHKHTFLYVQKDRWQTCFWPRRWMRFLFHWPCHLNIN